MPSNVKRSTTRSNKLQPNAFFRKWNYLVILDFRIFLIVFGTIIGVNFKVETSCFHQSSGFCNMRRHVSALIETQKCCSTLHPTLVIILAPT